MSPLDPQRARDRFHEGNLGGAIDDARALTGDANAPDFAQSLAAVAGGEWAAGLAAAERALAPDPGDALARWCRGEARYRASEATQVWHFLTHLWARERLRDSENGDLS